MKNTILATIICRKECRKALEANNPEIYGKKRRIGKTLFAYFDYDHMFGELYDFSDGMTITTDVWAKNDKGEWVETGKDPDRRNAPELIDVGIMGHCSACHTCSVGGCYQAAIEHQDRGNMSLDEYKKIVDEIKDFTYEIALGGSGNPPDHENFAEIMQYTYEAGMNPNFTTAMPVTDEKLEVIKKYAGAVAVSWHPKQSWETAQDYTLKAIKQFVDAGIYTNIHYVLSKQSVEFAIKALKTGYFDTLGIKNVIFLRYKPVGLAVRENCIDTEADITKEFFSLVTAKTFKHGIGFDSCCVPLIEKFTGDVDNTSLIPCESLSRSMYIGPEGMKMPCSFGNKDTELHFNGSVKDFWNSEIATKFLGDLKCNGQCPWV